MKLSPRTIVITGASRGLGAGMARWFQSQGHRLGLCSRGPASLQASETVLTAPVDVRDPTALNLFTKTVEDRFGGIDLWINNAGVLGPIGPLRDANPKSSVFI